MWLYLVLLFLDLKEQVVISRSVTSSSGWFMAEEPNLLETEGLVQIGLVCSGPAEPGSEPSPQPSSEPRF